MAGSLRDLRHRLHRAAERSGEESETASILEEELGALRADALHTGLGGHGIAVVFEGEIEGPSILVRSDMDALPLPDDPSLEYASQRTDTAHLCGHDGHMATVMGLAQRIATRRPRRGRVIVLFQPSEETGSGARFVLEDPAFAPLRPDAVVAQHNLPGFPLGTVVARKGVFASASRGMIVELQGRSAHAAEPHLGRSPVPAAASLMQRLPSLPQRATALHEAAQATVVGVEVGGPAFGTTPGAGRVMATLRAHEEAVMERLAEQAEQDARSLAQAHGLEVAVSWTEEFPSTSNDPGMVDVLARAAEDCGMPVVWPELPFAWSEDFGHFTAGFPGVLFGLGSGESQPALHAPGFDFPDALIEPGAKVLEAVVRLYLAPENEEGS